MKYVMAILSADAFSLKLIFKLPCVSVSSKTPATLVYRDGSRLTAAEQNCYSICYYAKPPGDGHLQFRRYYSQQNIE